MDLQVVLLGTGTPNAELNRSGPAVAVLVEDTPYLVDFGPGVVRQAAAACQQGVAGLAAEKLALAFLTHLHSDHTAGYPDLIFTPWVLERAIPLRVFGPAGIVAMTEHILAAYQEDMRERIEGLEPANLEGYRVIATEIEAGIVYQDNRVRVDACVANHGSWPAYSSSSPGAAGRSSSRATRRRTSGWPPFFVCPLAANGVYWRSCIGDTSGEQRERDKRRR